MKLAILGKGPTLAKYQGKDGYDQVWGLNQLGFQYDLDRLFVMDDFVLRLPYYSANDPDFPERLKAYGGLILTSQPYDEWPTSERYPIEEVAKLFGIPLGICMYSTIDYMLALAIKEKATRIDLYGVDMLDKGLDNMRASIAMWIGVAMDRGVQVTTQGGSFYEWFTNTGVCMEQGLYGYTKRPRIETLI